MPYRSLREFTGQRSTRTGTARLYMRLAREADKNAHDERDLPYRSMRHMTGQTERERDQRGFICDGRVSRMKNRAVLGKRPIPA